VSVSQAVRDSLQRMAPDAAPDLLGWRLTHLTEAGAVTIRLTEVEAYNGVHDPASHAYRGSTPRNAIMFGDAGRLYVYFSYGMHWCANIVCGPVGRASAVLLRAGQVVAGADLARARRGSPVADAALARGPACLTQALGIDKSHNGVDLVVDDAFRLRPGGPMPASAISQGPRVGVSVAHEVNWRFWLTGDETVSAYKRSPRA
jgi:DNA-3-methyladenine glycosylase